VCRSVTAQAPFRIGVGASTSGARARNGPKVQRRVVLNDGDFKEGLILDRCESGTFQRSNDAFAVEIHPRAAFQQVEMTAMKRARGTGRLVGCYRF